ncbi:hypothetical protein V8G54_004975 [Vigna mungo]|uniref:Uncharacterized protein n=1 Tax=Vigna mungo TaxID=3915 RepID=A0AAQ3SG14_VIGMU
MKPFSFGLFFGVIRCIKVTKFVVVELKVMPSIVPSFELHSVLRSRIVKERETNVVTCNAKMSMKPFCDIALEEAETRLVIVLNITKALIDGAGITLFILVDGAFANLPPSVALQSLPTDKKQVVLKFHVNPFQPSLASEAMGVGSFTLNISRVNSLIRTLLPFLGFRRNLMVTVKPLEGAPPPDEDTLSPENSSRFGGQPSHLYHCWGFRKDVRSHGGGLIFSAG